MIKRELYMNRIRPFIGGELIKVMTGIRRAYSGIAGMAPAGCPLQALVGCSRY